MIEVAKFIAEHADLIGLAFEAISGGVSKEELMNDIKAKLTAKQLAESNERMEKELGGS